MADNTSLMDKPNDRSMHSHPTVRGGGVVFIGLSLISLPVVCFLTQNGFMDVFLLMLCIFLIALISFLDDLYQLSVKLRFVVQCFVALLIALFLKPVQLDFGLFVISTQFLIVPFILIAVIWSINHFNFMDGLDGFCALQAIFLLSAYAYFFGLHDALMYQYFCSILIFSLLGFLIFNFPPAKLFMGDVGSATLGLITFALALLAQQKLEIPILYWFMLNGLFLFDATLTLIRRIKNREKWSDPHRKHAYQRIKRYGIHSHMILLGQMLINVSFLILVLLAQMHLFHLSLLLFVQLGFTLIIYLLIEKKFPMFKAEFTL